MLRIYRRPWPKLVPLLYRHSRAPPHILRRILTTSTATTTPVDIPKLPKGPGSKFHNSMPTFLDYAERTGLKPHTTVYIGTHFEYVVADALTRLGFSLIRTGKRLDDGIDLMGHWVLPPFREPIPVFLQCKARATQIPPAVARELEGSFQGLPPEWWNKDVLGLIVSDRTATRGLLETLGQSTYPMGFLKVTRDKGAIEQFLWNRAAADKGLQGLGVTLRHKPLMLEPKVKYQGGDWNWEEMRGSLHKRGLNKSIYTSLVQKDITLTWMGTPIFSNREYIGKTKEEIYEPTKGRPKKNAIEIRPAVKRPRGRPRKVVQEAKRPRGRPRKIVQEEKQPRGRPRKIVQEEKLPRGRPRKIVQEEKRPGEIVQEEKRPRGRPREVIQEVKRPRGRPRKNIVATAPKQRRRSAALQAEVNVPTELG
ncbi:hypothetical protein BS50DRAFT_545617 [Corynespora cassiicola Philippines]|uniref:Restriction endonuclease type IV Mrr domain-containing protein n=1 Tax=Corynespora cassiicola Philippines TaxID=1448308 RepID=A0A2T2NZ66_CORCC|nr:hypothetical protein BS50DRAFT_545617 [Corynespora cassiicola Philippines]